MKRKLVAIERPDRALDARMRRERDPKKRFDLQASMQIVQRKQRPNGVQYIARHLDVMARAYQPPEAKWFEPHR